MRRFLLLLFYALLITLTIWFIAGCKGGKKDHDHSKAETQSKEQPDAHAGHDHGAVDEHAGHDHGEVDEHAEDEHAAVDEHAGHDHGEVDEHEGHDDHGEEELVLSPKEMQYAGIQTKKTKTGRIEKTVELPGEVGLNEERVIHVVPRFPGIAKTVNKRLGNYVNKGDVLATIESNQSLSIYQLRAAISGRIIEKHVASGEFVPEGASVFVVADLSTVWINLSVYAKDLPGRPGKNPFNSVSYSLDRAIHRKLQPIWE